MIQAGADRAKGFEELFGGSFVPRRLGAKQPLTGATSAPPPAASAGAPLLSPILAAPAGKVWIAMENFGGHQFGEEVDILTLHGYSLEGSVGLIRAPNGWLKIELLPIDKVAEEVEARRPKSTEVPASGPAHFEETPTSATVAPAADEKALDEDAGDARTLFIDHDSEGNRYKEWRQVAVESKHYSYGDWPLEGPATVHHMIRHTQKYGGDPRLWLQVWARQKQIADNDRVMHELRCLTDMI